MEKLKQLRSWTHCKYIVKKDVKGKVKSSTIRVPACGLNYLPAIPYETAVQNAKNQIAGSPFYGFVFGPESEYIGLDIDVDPSGMKQNSTTQIPLKISEFLRLYPTHAHYSPNTFGLHIIYRIDSKTQKFLNENNLKQKAVSIEKNDAFNGDVRYRNSFLIFTSTLHPLSVNNIATIKLEALLAILPSIQQNSNVRCTPGDNEKNLFSAVVKTPSLDEFKKTLNLIPSSFNNEAKKVCKKLPYYIPSSNYDYWVMVASACAHQFISLQACDKDDESNEILKLFVDWSSKDTESFVSVDDATNKFFSLVRSTAQKMNMGENVTTYGTLKLLTRKEEIDFPDLVRKGKGKNSKLIPNPNSQRNIDVLIEQEGLTYIFDSMAGGVCFQGPDVIIDEHFNRTIDYKAYKPPGYSQVFPIRDMVFMFTGYMQKWFGASITPAHAKNALGHLWNRRRESNAFAMWIRSRPWDGKYRLEKVYRSIEIDEDSIYDESIYHNYIKKALYSLVGVHFFPGDKPTTPAMLILTGKEHTYKTTWANSLLPSDMEMYSASISTDTVLKNGADWYGVLATNAVVVIDECEPLFTPRHEQKLKDAIDKRFVTYREPYGVSSLSRLKTAIIIGTTNKPNLFTGTHGTRKFWQIPVKICDIEIFKTIDLQQLYSEILHKLRQFKIKNPGKNIQEAWSTTEQERDAINKANIKHRGDGTGNYALLCECFGNPLTRKFNVKNYLGKRGLDIRPGDPYDSNNDPNVWNATSMTKYLKSHYPDEKINRDAVGYALEDYAAIFTDTINRNRKPFGKAVNAVTKRKTIIRGKIRYSTNTYFYLMPPPLKVKGKDIIEIEENEGIKDADEDKSLV